MQRGRALRALALAALCTACAVLPGARASQQPGSLVSVEQVYSSLLVAPVHYPVTGFIALDRFTPLKHAEARAAHTKALSHETPTALPAGAPPRCRC
jgi:hypothetical protein